MFEKDIKEYGGLLELYRQKVTARMATQDFRDYNEIFAIPTNGKSN